MKRKFHTVKKHVITSFAALLLGVSSFTAFANADPADGYVAMRASYRAVVYPSTLREGEICIAVDRLGGEAMTIFLKDANGQVLGEKRVGRKLEKFQFKFILQGVPDGAYTVEISTPRDQSRHAFTLKTQPSTRIIQVK